MSVFCSTQGDPLINMRSKEQEAELVRQTLAALTAMRIRFPGKSEEEAESVLDDVSAFLWIFFHVPLSVTTTRRHIARWIDFRAKAGTDEVAEVVKRGRATGSKCFWTCCIPRVPCVARCGHSADLSPPPPHTHAPHYSPLTIAARVGLAPIVFQTTPLTTCLQNVAPLLLFRAAPSY